MPYVKTIWVNDVTPVNATNMNKLEDAIYDAVDAAEAAEAYVGDIDAEMMALVGRYQSEFNFDNAVYSNTEITSGVVSLTAGQVSGTVTKTITPSDLKSWGNLKWSQTLPANTDVVCDVLDTSDNVLVSDTSSISDLSAISVSSYTSLKVRFTLTRNGVGDTSPDVSSPSITWEGADRTLGTWEKISGVTLASNTAQVDFTLPTGYSRFKLYLRVKASTASVQDLNFRYNDNAGTYTRNCYYNTTKDTGDLTYGYLNSCVPASTGHFAYYELDIAVKSSEYTMTRIYGMTTGDGTGSIVHGFNTWVNTDTPIKLALYLSAQSFITASTFNLWGCR